MRWLFAALVLVAVPAIAQERSPADRQVLVDLAHVIGEAHALRQVCNGPNDQFWRGRMMNLLETEDSDFSFSERLREAFNNGFVMRDRQFPACTEETRAAEDRVAAQGQVLARRLAPPPAEPAVSPQLPPAQR